MKTYKIEYDSSAGPEDAMAGRAWDVIEMVDGRTTNIIASRCTGENAERIMRCLNAAERASEARPSAEAIMQAVARGWCHSTNSGKEVDPDLALAIYAEINGIGEQQNG